MYKNHIHICMREKEQNIDNYIITNIFIFKEDS